MEALYELFRLRLCAHTPKQFPIQSAERTVYGEGASGDNLRGKPVLQYDACGVSYIDQCYFNGVPQHAFRQLTADATAEADWTTTGSVAMDTDVYSGVATVDALGRPKRQRTDVLGTDTSGGGTTVYDLRYGRSLAVIYTDTGTSLTTYDKAGVAVTMSVSNLRSQDRNVVTGMRYNAKGQQEALWYGNGTKTGYTYDPKNYHVKRILTVNLATNDILQDLNYWGACPAALRECGGQHHADTGRCTADPVL